MQILFQNFELNKIIFYLNNNFLNILCNFSIFPSLLYLFLKYLLLYAILCQLIYLERIIFYANIYML